MVILKKVFEMGKRVFISADYSEFDGDRGVVNLLQKWGGEIVYIQ